MPKPILEIFENPTKYSGGITQFPADIRKRYDNSGGLEEQIYKLALTCNLFFEAERSLYFKDNVQDCRTTIMEVLDNKIMESGAEGGMFNYIKLSDQTAVPADKIGAGGYTIQNLEKYIENKLNPYAAKLW